MNRRSTRSLKLCSALPIIRPIAFGPIWRDSPYNSFRLRLPGLIIGQHGLFTRSNSRENARLGGAVKPMEERKERRVVKRDSFIMKPMKAGIGKIGKEFRPH